MKSVSSTEFLRSFTKAVAQADESPLVVHHYGQPKLIVMSPGFYQRMVSGLKSSGPKGDTGSSQRFSRDAWSVAAPISENAWRLFEAMYVESIDQQVIKVFLPVDRALKITVPESESVDSRLDLLQKLDHVLDELTGIRLKVKKSGGRGGWANAITETGLINGEVAVSFNAYVAEGPGGWIEAKGE